MRFTASLLIIHSILMHFLHNIKCMIDTFFETYNLHIFPSLFTLSLCIICSTFFQLYVLHLFHCTIDILYSIRFTPSLWIIHIISMHCLHSNKCIINTFFKLYNLHIFLFIIHILSMHCLHCIHSTVHFASISLQKE